MFKSVEHALCSSLNFPINKESKPDSEIPINTFGVFVTVRRSNAHKLKTYPEDIHGCIGYWEDNRMNKTNITQQIERVAHSAAWKDQRRQYFPEPIWRDPNALCEVDFMLLPTYKVDPVTGVFIKNNKEIKYDNNKYGLIAEDTKGRRATYLRYVFENKSWKYISNSLVRKAGSFNTEKKLFYAYDSTILKNHYYEILFYKAYWQFIFGKTQRFLLKHYKTHVPYEWQNNRAVIDKTQCVRNVATLYDIKQLAVFLNRRDLLTKIEKDGDYYAASYKQDKRRYRQCSAFLLLATNNGKLKTEIKKHLIENIDNLEPDFERGEVLMALALTSAESQNKILLHKQILKIHKELLSETEVATNDVFRYNWLAKFLCAAATISPNNVKSVAKLILAKLSMIPIRSAMETNYLAVMFEAYSCLYTILKTGDIHGKLLELVYYLMTRFNPDLGLFRFKNGSYRLDITGHIFNGFLQLLK